jgi:hypothetical protein
LALVLRTLIVSDAEAGAALAGVWSGGRPNGIVPTIKGWPHGLEASPGGAGSCDGAAGRRARRLEGFCVRGRGSTEGPVKTSVQFLCGMAELW